MKRFFLRQWNWYKALNKGPKFHLGDVVNIVDRFEDVHISYVTVVGTKFVHRDKYGEIVNRYKYLIDDDWRYEHHLRKIQMIENFELE